MRNTLINLALNFKGNDYLFLGGEIVSTFGRPELVRLGECKVIEEVMIGEDKVSFCDWEVLLLHVIL